MRDFSLPFAGDTSHYSLVLLSFHFSLFFILSYNGKAIASMEWISG